MLCHVSLLLSRATIATNQEYDIISCCDMMIFHLFSDIIYFTDRDHAWRFLIRVACSRCSQPVVGVLEGMKLVDGRVVDRPISLKANGLPSGRSTRDIQRLIIDIGRVGTAGRHAYSIVLRSAMPVERVKRELGGERRSRLTLANRTTKTSGTSCFWWDTNRSESGGGSRRASSTHSRTYLYLLVASTSHPLCLSLSLSPPAAALYHALCRHF